MKFTKEEISLCKQVAEGHEKPIKIGDWAFFDNKVRLVIKAGFDVESPITGEKERFIVFDDPTIPNLRRLTIHLDRTAPLWTISDCLEFLEKKGLNLHLQFMHFKLGGWRFTAEDNKYRKMRGEGETRLSACLKAVLAVLEEEK